MGSLSNCILLQLTLVAFPAILAQSQYTLRPLFQTLATLANLSDCWLCQQLDNAQEPELVFVPACAGTWWTHSGQWMYKREWYPQTRGQVTLLPPMIESFGIGKLLGKLKVYHLLG